MMEASWEEERSRLLGTFILLLLLLSIFRKCRRLEDNKLYAVKIVSQKFSHHALREVRILELVNPHKNVVQFVEVLCDPLHYYLVMEILEGGELLQRLRSMKAFNECQASRLMKQLVSAVSHLHQKGVVHRDLKPEVHFA
jgi:serine/threonine protein kinase